MTMIGTYYLKQIFIEINITIHELKKVGKNSTKSQFEPMIIIMVSVSHQDLNQDEVVDVQLELGDESGPKDYFHGWFSSFSLLSLF